MKDMIMEWTTPRGGGDMIMEDKKFDAKVVNILPGVTTFAAGAG